MANGSGDKDKSFEIKESDNSRLLSESAYVSQGLDRFPLLVWKRILEYYWSWDYLDMLNFIAVVKLPGDFLSDPTMHSVRKNVFFHVILPTLTANYVGSGYISDDASVLDFQDIYNCRLVCRAWNSAIRKNVVQHVSRSHPNCCLHEWENNFLWPRESRNPYANNCNNAYSLFSFTSYITKFLNHFRQSHKCQGDVSPFHCHHASFQLSSHNALQWMGAITMAAAAVFFAQYGKHLRLLNFNLYCREANRAGCLYPSVLGLLRESINLEALRISFRCLYSDGIAAFLKSGVKSGSFPELKLLTHLEVDGLPHLLFNDIIKSNGVHIEKLKISGLEGSSYALFRKYALHDIPLKNLRELRISFEFATINDIVRLSKSAPHWKKLKKLYLDFEGGDRGPKCIPWALILQCLNKFSTSVSHLWLSFPTLTSQLNVGPLHDYCPTREEQLKLKNLQQVVLKFPQGCAFSLDFLFGLKNLQTLYIHEQGVPLKTFDQLYKTKFVLVREYLNRRGPEKINYLLSRDLQYSNIWEQLPKLSKLYWRQLDKKCSWKKEMKSLKKRSHAESTAWTLRDRVEEIPEFWTRWWTAILYLH